MNLDYEDLKEAVIEMEEQKSCKRWKQLSLFYGKNNLQR